MMSEKPRRYSPAEINSIFAELNPQDVERFYQSYQLWTLQQQIAGLQTQITGLQQQIAENNERMQQAHPSAIALATLARLQSYGVTDIDLLERMLERGEAWLDQTMQHLAYCEQFDFIRNNYTEWCEHALDGAYDWIDSMQNASSSPEESSLAGTSTASAANTNGVLAEATEEILLQKLMSDEEVFMLEPTLKRPAVSPAQPEEIAAPLEQAPSDELTVSTQEEIIHAGSSDIPDSSHVSPGQALEVEQTEYTTTAQEVAPAGVSDTSDTAHTTAEYTTEPEHAEHIPAPEEVIPLEMSDTSDIARDTAEQATLSEQIEVEPVQPEAEEAPLAAVQDTLPPGEADLIEVADRPELSHVFVEQTPESEESPLAHDEDSLPALEAPLPISNNTSTRKEESLPSETNGFSSQTANQVSTQRSSQQHLRVTKPRRKRGFLRRLIAVLFRW